jgi:hypothetical protein
VGGGVLLLEISQPPNIVNRMLTRPSDQIGEFDRKVATNRINPSRPNSRKNNPTCLFMSDDISSTRSVELAQVQLYGHIK